jgi:hypothetical protein
MRVLGVIVFIVAGIVALIASCELGVVERYRYRLTMEVAAGDQVKSGSSVIQVVHRPDLVPGRGFRYQSTFSGEAVFVDLGSHGNLFLTLESTGRFGPATLPMMAFLDDQRWWLVDQKTQFARLQDLVKQRAKVALRPDQLLTLVTFKDINQPGSVVEVDPRDVQAVLGPDVRLVAVTVEMTTDPVTKKLDQVLPWLPALAATGASLDGSNSLAASRPAASRLYAMSFQSLGFR